MSFKGCFFVISKSQIALVPPRYVISLSSNWQNWKNDSILKNSIEIWQLLLKQWCVFFFVFNHYPNQNSAKNLAIGKPLVSWTIFVVNNSNHNWKNHQSTQCSCFGYNNQQTAQHLDCSQRVVKSNQSRQRHSLL